jgi:hypothetical protein
VRVGAVDWLGYANKISEPAGSDKLYLGPCQWNTVIAHTWSVCHVWRIKTQHENPDTVLPTAWSMLDLGQKRLDFILVKAVPKKDMGWTSLIFNTGYKKRSDLEANNWTVCKTKPSNALGFSCVLQGMVFRYQAASCESLQGRQNEDQQEIAIKVACYLLTDDINGQELGRFYCLCQTRRCMQQRNNSLCFC